MVAWPDFGARLQRFLVIGLGLALVMAITLLLSAFSEGFRLRSEHLLDAFGGDRYIAADGASGPMTSSTLIPSELVDVVADAGVGLGERLAHRPSEMSGGPQQRVSLARALAHDPPIIIAAEPTASLDYVQVEGVLRLLRDLAAPGRVVVVATHDHRLLPPADQIIEMVPRFHEDASPPTTIQLAPSETLFTQRSRGNRIYVIESGSIEIAREHTDGLTDVLATLEANEHFGEMGPLFGLPRSATARAGSRAFVVGYAPEQFRKHIGAERLTDLIRHDESALSGNL